MSAGKQWLRSHAKNHWHTAFHTVAARRLKVKYESAKVDPGTNEQDRLHIYWRLGYNLFYAGQYFDAIGILEVCCRNGKSEEEILTMLAKRDVRVKASEASAAGGGSLMMEIASEEDAELEAEEEEILHGNYHVHMMAGRCCVQLFLQTSAHYHLENSYRHYKNCIENMSVPDDWQKKSLLRLPVALHEMGHLFEHYGAFPSAIDLYTRVMTDYPDYRRYFDCMYRAALVGRHVAESLAKPDDSDAMLNKCIDMLQFLLEALPSTIDESHAILLYGRTLDKHRDPAIRYRALGVYKNLYDNLRVSKRCNADQCLSYKDWGEVPTNWYQLGVEIAAAGEPLLAKDAFEMYVAKLESKRQAGKDLTFYMNVEQAMKVAKNLASFQNFSEATKFAEIALSHNRLSKEVRTCLSKWSKIHATKLHKEASAINTIHDHWRTRVWSETYRNKLKTHTVEELEERIETNHFDVKTRDDLAYFARDKWRARFLFETSCAVRLQRFMRGRFQIWKAQTRLRTRYLNRAVDAYRLYCRKPWDWALREEIKAICRSKHCPRKHIINKVINAIYGQDEAVLILQRVYAAHRGRQAIRDGIRRTKQRKEERLRRCAMFIQCMVRARRAHKRMLERRRWMVKRVAAAKIIQNYVRWRNSTFQHAVTRVVYKQKCRHREARNVFIYVFSYHFRRHIRRRHEAYMKRQRELQERLERERRFARINHLHKCSRLVSRFFALLIRKRQTVAARLRLAARRSPAAGHSHLATATFWKTFFLRPDNTVKPIDAVALDPSCRYEPPGVSQASRQFQRALDQSSLYCHGTFSSADCMMLATVLRHPNCRLQRLVLHDVVDAQNAAFEFDLLPAISRCRALRTVQLIGGAYTQGFIHGLIRDVQTENPRIKEILLERVVPPSGSRGRGEFAAALSNCAARLVMDYFNYSVPGLTTLSLHGCALTDADIELLSTGVSVNSSIKALALSQNALTDLGLLSLLAAWSGNAKTNLALLDLRHNLIACGSAARHWMNIFVGASNLQSHSRSGATAAARGPESDDEPLVLDVLLAWNMISRPYPDSDDPRATQGHRIIFRTSELKPVTLTEVAQGVLRNLSPTGVESQGFKPTVGEGGPVFRRPKHKRLPKTNSSPDSSPKKFLAEQSAFFKGGW